MDIIIKKIINILNNQENEKINQLNQVVSEIDEIHDFTIFFQDYLRNNLDNFDDKCLLILIKVLISNNLEYFKKNIIINKLKKGTENIIPNTINFIKNFYNLNTELAKKKIWIKYFREIMKEQFKDNTEFKNVNSNNKLNIFVNILLQRLKAIFDRTFGNQDFIIKMFALSKYKNLDSFAYIHEEEICNRIKYCYKLVGKDFFEKYKIKVITVEDFFNNYSFIEKCEYMKYVNDSLLKILLKTKLEIKSEDKITKAISNSLYVTDLDFLSDSDTSEELQDIDIDIDIDENSDEEEESNVEKVNISINSDNDDDDFDFDEEDIEKVVDNDDDLDLADSNEDLKADSNEDLKADSNEDLKADSNEDLEADSNEDLEADSNEEFIKTEYKDERKINKNIELKDNSIIILNDEKINNLFIKWRKINNQLNDKAPIPPIILKTL